MKLPDFISFLPGIVGDALNPYKIDGNKQYIFSRLLFTLLVDVGVFLVEHELRVAQECNVMNAGLLINTMLIIFIQGTNFLEE